MKIVFCLGSLDKGGTQRVVSNLANYLINNNNVSIITTKQSKIQYDLNSSIKVFSLDKNPSKKSNNLCRLFRLIKIVKNENPDIILTFQPEPSYRLLIANFFLKKKIILSVRNDPNIEYSSFKRKKLMKILYPKANLLVLQTEDAKTFFKKYIDLNKMVVISNPLNENFICKPYKGRREKTIVNIGRLTEQKNQILLIDAFSEVYKKHPDYTLKIYGSGSLYKDLKDYISFLKLDEKVLLMGEVDDVKTEIYKAGMFVLTSNFEGMPNALMEAMALGLPCISTDCPCGGPKSLINNKNGILVNLKDKKALVDNINYLIENPKEAKILGNNANNICETQDPKTINAMWEKSINSLIKKDFN